MVIVVAPLVVTDPVDTPVSGLYADTLSDQLADGATVAAVKLPPRYHRHHAPETPVAAPKVAVIDAVSLAGLLVVPAHPTWLHRHLKLDEIENTCSVVFANVNAVPAGASTGVAAAVPVVAAKTPIAAANPAERPIHRLLRMSCSSLEMTAVTAVARVLLATPRTYTAPCA